VRKARRFSRKIGVGGWGARQARRLRLLKKYRKKEGGLPKKNQHPDKRATRPGQYGFIFGGKPGGGKKVLNKKKKTQSIGGKRGGGETKTRLGAVGLRGIPVLGGGSGKENVKPQWSKDQNSRPENLTQQGGGDWGNWGEKDRYKDAAGQRQKPQIIWGGFLPELALTE